MIQLNNNWDKIVAILAIIISGIIGYYSAIYTVKDEIRELKIEYNNLRVEMDKVVTPKFLFIDGHSGKISQLETKIEILIVEKDQLKGQQEKLYQQQQKNNSYLLNQKGSYPNQPVINP